MVNGPSTNSCAELVADRVRVEKYRPSTLDDVSGHQDILATINRFVDTDVCEYRSSYRSKF